MCDHNCLTSVPLPRLLVVARRRADRYAASRHFPSRGPGAAPPPLLSSSCHRGPLPTSAPYCDVQGCIIRWKLSRIVYNTYCIVLCIVLCIIFTYYFRIIQPKSSCIIHNTQYNTYYVLIHILFCHTLYYVLIHIMYCATLYVCNPAWDP